jgi:hypothetical protein
MRPTLTLFAVLHVVLLQQDVCCAPYEPASTFIINPASDDVKAATAHFTQRLHRAGVPVRINGAFEMPVPECSSDDLPGTSCARECGGETTYNYQGLC